MPGNKRWYFEEQEGTILLWRDGKEVTNRMNQRIGPVKEVFYGSEHPQAKTFKLQALEVSFQSGHKVLLNRQNFEWNKSSFSEQFKTTSTAGEFIAVWNRATILDQHRQLAVSISETNDVSLASVAGSSQSSTTSPHTGSTHRLDPSDADISLQPASKRSNSRNSSSGQQHANPIDDTIHLKRIGLYQLPVTSLVQPQSDLRLIRKLDATFLSNLKKRIKEDPSGPGVPPVAVLCTDIQKKDDFSERLKESYRYEVLGGQHTAAAKAELFRDYPNNPLYNQVFAEVFVGLNDQEALRLASRHNENGHFIHRMTHKDYLQSCRAMLYNISDSNETLPPTPTTRWKNICKECILAPGMSRTHCENIFTQAAFTPAVWEAAIKVIELFEDGQLKAQRLSKKSMIFAKPEFKQHHFQCLHNMEPSIQEEILQKVGDREITLDEMKKMANELRTLGNIEKAFMKCTNTTWEEALRRFPWHTNQERLKKFVGLNFFKNVPETFQSYCEAAIRGESLDESLFCFEGCVASTHVLQLTELSVSDLKSAYPSYTGAHLILTMIPKSWDQLQVQQLAFTTRQVNSVERTPQIFNVAVMCSQLSQLKMVHDAIDRCFDHVEELYYYDESVSFAGSGFQLVEATGVIVVGHFSIDGELKKEHYSAKNHNMLVVQGKMKLMEEIIGILTFPGQCMLHLVTNLEDGQAHASVASLMAGRNYIGIVQTNEDSVVIKKEWAKLKDNPDKEADEEANGEANEEDDGT